MGLCFKALFVEKTLKLNYNSIYYRFFKGIVTGRAYDLLEMLDKSRSRTASELFSFSLHPVNPLSGEAIYRTRCKVKKDGLQLKTLLIKR